MRLKPSQILYWGCFLGLLAIDQIVKAQVRAHFAVGESRTLLPALLDLRLTYNEGIAFGKLQGFGVYLAPVAIVIAIFAGIYSARHPEESRWTHAAMGLLASGALGNMLDRIMWHRVTDMFEFRFVQFPVFNVADACITVAAAILIVKWGLEALHPTHKPGPTPPPLPADAEEA